MSQDISSVPGRDGLWHADQRAGNRTVERNALKKSGLVTWRQRIYFGHIYRYDVEQNKWENETCPHWHTKRTVAVKCAEQAARRWNRVEKAEKGKEG
jgi:hypothetical protein